MSAESIRIGIPVEHKEGLQGQQQLIRAAHDHLLEILKPTISSDGLSLKIDVPAGENSTEIVGRINGVLEKAKMKLHVTVAGGGLRRRELPKT